MAPQQAERHDRVLPCDGGMSAGQLGYCDRVD